MKYTIEFDAEGKIDFRDGAVALGCREKACGCGAPCRWRVMLPAELEHVMERMLINHLKVAHGKETSIEEYFNGELRKWLTEQWLAEEARKASNAP